MMVMAASDSNANVISILSTLQSKISSKDDRIKAYTTFSNYMKEDELSLFNLDVAKHADHVWSVLQQDIMNDQPLVAHSALQVLGFFLHDSDNVRSLSATNVGNVVPVLKDCVLQTEDKTTCTRALWCLSQQNLPTDIISKNVSVMLDSAEFAMEKWKLQSITVENEASNIIARILDVCPNEMTNHIVRWGKILLVQLVHSAVKIREKALEVVNTQLSTLMTEQKVLSKFVMKDFSKKFGAEMERLFGSRHEVHVLKTWGILVQILGDVSCKILTMMKTGVKNHQIQPFYLQQDLHRGSFINHVLPIAELGFKSSNPEVKCVTFQAWQQLIDNFATNNAILTDPKRIKLVMQVFKLNNAKSENVALVKLQVWWHFVWLLGQKASSHFDQVCVPLLNFCLGSGKLNNHLSGAATPRALKNGTSPITPQMNLGVLGSSSAPPVIPNLQLKGCEVLAHILGSLPNDLDFPCPSYTMDPLSHELIPGPSSFYKHANLLVNSTTEFICSLGKKIPEALLYQIWYSLLAHMKNGLEHLKAEMREILTSFLTQFQVIILSQALPQKVLLKMFEVVCCLPRKSLTSTAYNVGNGERIHGTPALFLTELLLTPVLLATGAVSESYMTLFGILVDCGINTSSGSLEFCQSTIQMLEQNREFVEVPEMMWRLWSGLVNPLHEHIKKTNEVNQGDALEHNFNCLYAVLIFPVQQGLVTSMSQASVKTMLKTWCDLYKTFARLSALVTNAEANICCEELCQRFLKLVSPTNLEEVGYLEYISQCCLAMVNAVDYSSLGSVPTFNLNGLSPAKWAKKKQKPMDNVQSLVMLMQRILEATMIAATKGDFGKPNVGSIPNTASVTVDVLIHLFTHVNTSNSILSMITHLAQPIADLFEGSAGKTTAKIYTNIFQQKIEKLWQTITNSLQSKFTSKADSELLAKLSPLLEATFLHPRRAMKNITTNFWKTEFSQSAPLVYPESLKPVLSKVKEKTSIVLPGWSAVSISVVEETPISQMSQAESQAPEPRLPGMPSPVKMHGSFLNKAVSPHIKKSPAKPVTMEAKGQEVVKRDLLSVNGMKNDDFVVIKSPPRKKRVLTEHQKEVFREKKNFPAMYNSLDLSQDVSMMSSQFGSENTQNESQLPSLDSVVVVDSSGSQVSQSIMNHTGSVKATREENTANEKLMKQPGKVKRRRSVRFRDSDKQDEVDSIQRTSIDDIESRSIDHFSVIQQAMGQTEDAGEIMSTSEKNSPSSEESSVIPSIPQNPLGVIGIFEQLSSKSFSLDSKKSDNSSSQKSEEENVLEGLAGTTSNIQRKQPLLSWSNKLTALSQSPLSHRKIMADDSPDKSQLQEDEQSSQEKNDSSRKGKITDLSGQAKLDKWFSQPSTLQEAEKARTEIPDSVPISQVVTVIEETQSPAKHEGREQNTVKGSIPDNESPARVQKQTGTRGSHKKLFGGESGKEMEDLMEDSNIIPASPPKLRNRLAGKVGTPVLMLKRLTDDDIKQFSPTRKNSSQNSPAGKNGHKSEENNGEDMPQDSEVVNEMHEHDDFSEIRPLDSEDVIPSSQGFSTSTGVIVKSDISHTESSEMEKTTVYNQSETDVSEQNKEIDKDTQETSLSENLFKDAMSDMNSYDPGLESTFKDGTSATPKMFDTRNLNTLEKDENMQTDSVKSMEQITSVCENSNKSYNPKEISTMASDVPTPGRGRKRKQTSPMHMSPDSIKPKRTRKTPKKYSNFDEITYEVETRVKRTPKSGKPRSQRRQKQVETPLPEEVKNGPMKVLVDIHVSPDKKTEFDLEPENNNDIKLVEQGKHVNESEVIFNISDSQEKIQNGAIEIKESVHSNNSDVTQGEEKEMNDKISGKMDKNPELEELIGEKTPEGRSSRSTPYRKSTTKTKKEVIQRRARQMEIVINSGTSNLDSESSEDDSCVVKISEVSESRSDASFHTAESTSESQSDANSHKSFPTLESEMDSGSQDSQQNNCDIISGSIGLEDMSNSNVPVHQANDENITLNNDKEQCSETGHGEEDCVVDKDLQSSSNTNGIPDSNEDLPLSLLNNSNEGSAKESLRSESDDDDDDDDDVPLSQIKPKERKKVDKRKEDKIEKDDVMDEDVPLSQLKFKERMKGDQKMKKSEIEKDVLDVTESQDSTDKKTSRKSVEKKTFTLTRSQTSITRSGSKRRTLTGMTNKSDNKNLSLKKTSRQKKLKSKKDDKVSENGSDFQNVENEVDTETRETLENVQPGTPALDHSEADHGSQNMEKQINNGDKDADEHSKNKIIRNENDNNNDDNFESAESPVIRQENELDETPRKIPNKSFIPSGCTLFESQSDSKLMSTSRKFDKGRHIVARRSILKQPSPSQDTTGESSPIIGKKFHPIRVGNVHSPSASPSAGILKKQRLSGDIAAISPSPPGKQRRVCFAHPLTREQDTENPTNQEIDLIKLADCIKSTSPLASASRVTFSSEKAGKDSQLTPTQSSYRSTPESQLNSTDPIYPELLECADKVDKILPQLTTSMWMRGLGQLVRARNIHTIGDLSALTEREVDNLPIKSPKVSIVRSVLQKFETQKESRKVKNQKLNTVTKAPVSAEITEEESLSPVKKLAVVNQMENFENAKLTAEKGDEDSDPFPTSSHGMLEDMDCTDSLPTTTNPSDVENPVQNTESSESAAGSLLHSLEDIVSQCNDKTRMSEFGTSDIFQIHHHLTNLTATVMSVLKDRCKCPDS
ncbi:telomere-associated protein RIF1-like [Ylistrum balloti]|uniref:telomere-associated protein RIF1-like n=1 Tax=Ylistrum balloti TaxID=509963 RepID=UPI002905CFD0|nr:telomere-associated protein RIF1-like [Ylistrum balloti]